VLDCGGDGDNDWVDSANGFLARIQNGKQGEVKNVAETQQATQAESK
jgi:hypothetical protein